MSGDSFLLDQEGQTPPQSRTRDYADEVAPHPSLTTQDPPVLGITVTSE
jgi:hypothetical protein